MEQLLSDVQPPRDKVFADLVKEMQEGLIVPVLLGSAENGNGILRLLKALRHEAPFVDTHGQAPQARECQVGGAGAEDHVFVARRQAVDRARAGRRVRRGHGSAGRPLRGARRVRVLDAGTGGQEARAWPRPATRWRWAGWRRSTPARRCRSTRAAARRSSRRSRRTPVYGIAISIKDRKDEVKLTGALGRLMEEDPSLRLEHNKDTHQMVLWGQGEMHLRVSLERLKRKYGVDAELHRRQVPYKETIKKARRGARPAQEAVGRARPVRRRGARHQAAAARLGLPVRRDDHRRRGAAPVHPLGGDRRVPTICTRDRSAVSRWSTCR